MAGKWIWLQESCCGRETEEDEMSRLNAAGVEKLGDPLFRIQQQKEMKASVKLNKSEEWVKRQKKMSLWWLVFKRK